MTVKTYSRRDSCTTVLRKMGVDKKDYDFFIDKQGDVFVCRTDKAERHLAQIKDMTNQQKVMDDKMVGGPKLDEKSKATKQLMDKVAKAPRRTVTGRARELIFAGKTNEQIWVVLQAEFQLDDSKKHYPAWNRAFLIRTGVIK